MARSSRFISFLDAYYKNTRLADKAAQCRKRMASGFTKPQDSQNEEPG